MTTLIALVLSNFTLTFLVVGLIFSAVAIARAAERTAPVIVEALLKWFLFWSVGVSHLYNGVMHTAFGDKSAPFYGWANTPFQIEVGSASLGFAAVGFLAVWRSFDMRLAAVLGPAIFLWGAAGGHIYQMVAAGNFAPGNAGTIFWTDIFLPVIGFGLLWLQHRHQHAGTSPAP